MVFYFTNDDQFNVSKLLESSPDFFEFYDSEILPTVAKIYPEVINANFGNPTFWVESISELIDKKMNSPDMLSFAKNHPHGYSMCFPHSDSKIIKADHYQYNIYNRFKYSPNLDQESELMDFVKMFLSKMVETYQEKINDSFRMPANLKEIFNDKIYNFAVFHSSMFDLPEPRHSPTKPYTEEELAQHSIWADEFELWWEHEGQFHRAGAVEYSKTFAWYAWLNREQVKQEEILRLNLRIKELEAELAK